VVPPQPAAITLSLTLWGLGIEPLVLPEPALRLRLAVACYLQLPLALVRYQSAAPVTAAAVPAASITQAAAAGSSSASTRVTFDEFSVPNVVTGACPRGGAGYALDALQAGWAPLAPLARRRLQASPTGSSSPVGSSSSSSTYTNISTSGSNSSSSSSSTASTSPRATVSPAVAGTETGSPSPAPVARAVGCEIVLSVEVPAPTVVPTRVATAVPDPSAQEPPGGDGAGMLVPTLVTTLAPVSNPVLAQRLLLAALQVALLDGLGRDGALLAYVPPSAATASPSAVVAAANTSSSSNSSTSGAPAQPPLPGLARALDAVGFLNAAVAHAGSGSGCGGAASGGGAPSCTVSLSLDVSTLGYVIPSPLGSRSPAPSVSLSGSPSRPAAALAVTPATAQLAVSSGGIAGIVLGGLAAMLLAAACYHAVYRAPYRRRPVKRAGGSRGSGVLAGIVGRASSRNPFTEGSTVIVEPGTEEAPSTPGGDGWPSPAAGSSVAYHSNPLQLQLPRSSRPSLPSPAARTRHPASVSPSRAPALASSLRGLAGNSGGWPLVAASSFPPSLAPGSGGERGPSHPLTSSLRRQQPRLADGSARSSSPRVTGSDSLSPPPGHMVSLRALLSQGLTPRTAAGVVAPSGRGPADGGAAAGRADAPPLVVVSSPRDLSGSLSSRRRGGSPGVVVAASSPRQPPLDGTILASSLASQQPLGSLSSRGSPPAHAHYYYHGDSEDDRVAAPRVQQAAGAALEDAPLSDLAQAAPPHLRGLLAAQQQHAADAQAAAAAAVAHAARQGHALLELAAAATAASSGAGGSGSGGSGGFSPSSRSVRWGAATRAARPAAAADAAHGGGRAAPAAHES
jgi:hypothetical protein